MIYEVNLLTESECSDISTKIQGLRESWTQRHEHLPFYTLGKASYLDAVQDKEKYYREAQIYNPILQENFGELYERLSHSLSTTLDASVAYYDKAAMPGFHIFLAHKAFELPMGSIHMDLQYRSLDWSLPEPLDSYPLVSFTLAISLPKSGGGLNLWDIHHQEVAKLSQVEFSKLIPEREQKFCNYQVGTMIIHSGHQVHQIAPAKNIIAGDMRITLQGHALFFDNVWHLYW
jgi:hypothetical protein